MSPTAIADLAAGVPPAVAKGSHATLMRKLEAHGCLVVTSQGEAKQLIAAVRGLGEDSAGAKQRWLTLLEELRKQGRVLVLSPPGSGLLGQVSTLAELRSGWAGKTQIAVLPGEKVEALGPAVDGILVDPTSRLEIAASQAVSYGGTLQRMQSLTDIGHAETRSSREGFWSDVLGPIASVSRNITVLDQYLYGDMMRRYGSPHARRRGSPEFLVWLLEHLDSQALAGTELVLIGGGGTDPAPRDAVHGAQILRELWQPSATGRLSKVTMHLAQRQRGGERFPHDRHLRSNAGVAISLPAGFDRLGSEAIRDPDGMSWRYLWGATPIQPLRAAEQRILKSSGTQEAMVLSRA